MTETAQPTAPPRARALDALRGLAILLMCLSGVVPEGLPNFMYHGYHPRFLPDVDGVWTAVANPHRFRADWPGFTWVDWVFPLFLFAMGAAFPLALGRRLDRGVPVWQVVLGVLGRGLTLIAFAVYVRQIIPQVIENPTSPWTWCLGLIGFVLPFPVLMRLPKTWPRTTTRTIRAVGVVLATGFVVFLNLRDDGLFAWSQNDIIILLLAHMSIAGSLIWLVSRRRLWLRLALLALVWVAHDRAIRGGWGWLDPLVDFPKVLLDLTWINRIAASIPPGLLDLSALYDFNWYKFLAVVIPGTIIGDLLVEHASRRDPDNPESMKDRRAATTTSRWLAVAAVMTGLIVVVLVGLQCHGRVLLDLGGSLQPTTPWATWIGAAPLLAWGITLLHKRVGHHERCVRKLFFWGTLWLLLGLAAEPFEGGIKKGPPSTISYYLVATGLSIFLLGVFTVWIDVLKKRRGTSVLVFNGQNPMLAYVGIRNLLAPLVMLPLLAPLAGMWHGLGDGSINGMMLRWLPSDPWLLAVWSLAQMVLLGLTVALFTRVRVVWRA